MRIQFDPPQTDANLLDITVAKEDDSYSLEMVCKSAENLKKYFGLMNAYRRLYNTDTGVKQEFNVEKDDKKYLLKITGNLANALQIMTERKLISDELFKILYEQAKCRTVLEESKTFSFPREETDELSSDDEETVINKEPIVLLKKEIHQGAQKYCAQFFSAHAQLSKQDKILCINEAIQSLKSLKQVM